MSGLRPRQRRTANGVRARKALEPRRRRSSRRQSRLTPRAKGAPALRSEKTRAYSPKLRKESLIDRPHQIEQVRAGLWRKLRRILPERVVIGVREHVEQGSLILTDEFPAYRGLEGDYAHSTINHSAGNYVDGNIHTNTMESYWSLLKRGIFGIYHQVSAKHLHRYCNEFGFRWNHRKITDGERMVEAMKGAEGKRLMYREPA